MVAPISFSGVTLTSSRPTTLTHIIRGGRYAQGRKPDVTYWQSRGGYGCWIDGNQHILAKGPNDAPTGPTYLEALDRFRRLLAMEKDKGTDDYLGSSLFSQYRIHLHATRKSGVPGVFDVIARGFAGKFCGKRGVAAAW